jgi:hypothetical protein
LISAPQFVILRGHPRRRFSECLGDLPLALPAAIRLGVSARAASGDPMS